MALLKLIVCAVKVLSTVVYEKWEYIENSRHLSDAQEIDMDNLNQPIY